MSITSDFNEREITENLPLNWYIKELEHDSIIKIMSESNNNFITIQKWDGVYIVLPYIQKEYSKYTYYDEQKKRCSKINDAFYHSTLLIESWID